MSGASERANGRASGPVLTSLFLAVLPHCAGAAAASGGSKAAPAVAGLAPPPTPAQAAAASASADKQLEADYKKKLKEMEAKMQKEIKEMESKFVGGEKKDDTKAMYVDDMHIIWETELCMSIICIYGRIMRRRWISLCVSLTRSTLHLFFSLSSGRRQVFDKDATTGTRKFGC